MTEAMSRALRDRYPQEVTSVGSLAEFVEAASGPDVVSFLDGTTIAELERAASERGVTPAELGPVGPVIAICDGPLATAIAWLPSRPWLSHVISAAMLSHPMATEHVSNVIAALSNGHRPRLLDWVPATVNGRRVRLTHASRRVDRLERMGEFFEANGFGGRTVQLLRDAAEELLTNAFYDAPVAAGASKKPIPRTQDVALPDDGACDMIYGSTGDLAIVRVRDPFGSLSRKRIVEVLTRCARTDMQVQVDESMGGAGLGMWRIFAVASFVAISVVSHHHTDVLVGIAKRAVSGARPFAFHLFFEDAERPRFWRLLQDDATQQSYASFTIEIETD